jgi:LEA14-like dessication related protein
MRGPRGRDFRVSAVFLGLGTLLASAGCLTFRRPEVAFRGVEVRSFGSSGADLEASFDVTNPNNYKIGVESLTYRLTVNGRDAGGGTIDTATPLPAKETTQVVLPLSLDWEKLKGAGLDFLMSNGVDYAVDGEITFSTPMGTFHRPYRHVGRYSPFDR